MLNATAGAMVLMNRGRGGTNIFSPDSKIGKKLQKVIDEIVTGNRLGRATKAGILGGIGEGVTEFTQSGIEYGYPRAVSEKGIEPRELFDQALLGGVVGAGTGSAVGSVLGALP